MSKYSVLVVFVDESISNNELNAYPQQTPTESRKMMCPNKEMEKELCSALEVLKTWMQDEDTCPDIIACVTKSLMKRKPGEPFEALASQLVQQAMK